MTGNYSKVTHFFANLTIFGRKLKQFIVVVLIFSVDSESVIDFFNSLRGEVRSSNFFPQHINKNSNTDSESTLKMSTTNLIF